MAVSSGRRRRGIVVGMGSIGRRHARLLAGREDVEVEICEPDDARAQAALAELGERAVHHGFDEALESRPDFLVVATPHGLHADQTVRALDAGIPTLCEKPMSDRLEEARRMVEAARRSSAVLTFGFHMHFHPGARRLKRLIDSGALGELLHVHMRVGSYITLVNSVSRYQAALEGALLLDYAHQPDLLYWFLRERPQGVYMAGGRGGELELSSNPNVLSLTCDFAGPLLATVHLNYVQMPERHEYELVGDRGWAVWDRKSGVIRVGAREERTESRETVSTERDTVYRDEHQAFFDAVDGRRGPESPAEDAVVSLEIIEASLRSWRDRERRLLASR